MYMAYVRKNVMFYLMVQPSREPVYDPVFGAKVYRGGQLVNGPGILHGSALIGQWGICLVNDMCQLEDNAQNDPGDIMHYKKPKSTFHHVTSTKIRGRTIQMVMYSNLVMTKVLQLMTGLGSSP